MNRHYMRQSIALFPPTPSLCGGEMGSHLAAQEESLINGYVRFIAGVVAAAALFLCGCTAPIGADLVTIRQAYAQSEANALRAGDFSSHTVVLLHRYGLDDLAAAHPDQAVSELHKKALANGERGLLFALAELSYVAGDRIRGSLKPWEPRDGRDYYLGATVYAWLYLF